MIIAGTDTETTGLHWSDHKIIEINIGLWDSASQKRIFNYDKRINPGRSIQIEAQRVHGITLLDLEGKPAFEEVSSDIAKIFSKADLVVAHNGVGFDIPFINHELKKAGSREISAPCFDTMIHGRWATPDGKVPKLEELCLACDVEYSDEEGDAHAADYDVEVMMKCYFYGLKYGFFKTETEKE